MTAILSMLLEITIYSAILYGALLIFKRIFRRHISVALNYAVWMLLIIRLLIPITINSSFSLIVVPAPAAAIAQEADTDNTVHEEQVIGAADSQQASSADESVNDRIAVNVTDAKTTAATTPSIQALDWQTALVLLWAVGMLGSFVFAVVSAKRLKRQMNRSSREIPAYILSIIDEYKKELSIKRKIEATMHDWLNSPALTASPRPRLLLSGNLLAMNRRQVEFGIRHEFTHYKHRDHLMILLLIFLRCVHWFNPVVWFAFPQIQMDMETLCDAGATSGFQKNERSTYIHTMVELSRGTNVRYVLGMGQGRKMLEKRVRGMFMKQTTTMPVRLTALILGLVLLFSCFTTACRPTPASAVVISKDMQQMLDKAKTPHDTSLSLKERLAVPDRFTGSAQDEAGKFTAKMDADIVIPDVNDIPIVRVQAQPFDHDIVEKIKDYFFDDGPSYDPQALSEETKDELIDILAKLKARKAELEDKGMKPLHPELENGEYTEEMSKPRSDSSAVTAQMSEYNMLDQVNESILYIKSKIPTALDEKNLIEISDNWQPFGESSENLSLAQPNPDGGMRLIFSGNGLDDMLYVNNRKDFDVVYGFYYTEDEWNAWNNSETDGANIADAQSLSFPSISMDEAQQIADDFLAQVGIEGFICERNEKVIGGSGQTYGDSLRRGNLLKGYRLQYVRQVNGVPLTYTDDEMASGGQDEQSFFYWRYESITFIVDDSGIAELQWQAPHTVQDTVVNSASMLPFSDITDIFKNKMTTINAWMDVKSLDITITEARLGFMRVIEQNGTKTGLLIPVWDFFGSTTQTVVQDGKEYVDTYKSATRSLMTINAIDGAVIDRQKGY